MRWCGVLSIAVATACGGRSHGSTPARDDATGGQSSSPDGGGASRQPCETSFLCPAGERCEGGACVADRDCPVPVAPQKLPSGELSVYSTTGIELYDGVEHVVALDASLRTVLLRLPDGPLLTIARPADCMALTLYLGKGRFPVRCRSTQGEFVFRSLVASGNGMLTPMDGQPVTVPTEMQLNAFAFPTWDTELVVSSDSVYELEPTTSGLTELLPLGGRTLTTPITKNGDWGPGLVATDTGPEGVTHWAAPATPGAAWTKLGTLPTSARLLPVGGAWYGLADEEPELTRVWRLVDGTARELGVGARIPPNTPGWGEGSAANGRSLVGCDEHQRCTLYRVDLDPPSVEPRAEVAIPTDDILSVVVQRELACSSVEVFITTLHQQSGQWPTLAYYWTRVVPDQDRR